MRGHPLRVAALLAATVLAAACSDTSGPAEATLEGPLRLNVQASDTLEVAPGATFRIGTWSVDPTLVRRFASTSAAVVSLERSVVPGVSTWSPGHFALLRARGPGVATVSVAYGGQHASFVVAVRDPGPLAMDEVGRCGLNAAGELWCRGANRFGQLGALTPVDDCNRWCYLQGSEVPVRGARGMRFKALTSGESHSCAIALDDGRAYCWGLDRASFHESVGRLAGNIRGTLDVKYCPVDPSSSAYAPVPCSASPLPVDGQLDRRLVFSAIKVQGRVTCGTVVASPPHQIWGPEAWCWGDTTSLPAMRDAFPVGWPHPSVADEVPLTRPLVLNFPSADTLEVAPGTSFIIASVNIYPGTLSRYGVSSGGVATVAPVLPRASQTHQPFAKLRAVQPGVASVEAEYGGQRAAFVLRVREPGPLTRDEVGRCALDASGGLWCRGSNVNGELGTRTPSDGWVRVETMQNADAWVRGARHLRFKALTSGPSHSCAIADDARGYCWGLHELSDSRPGRLGGPTTREQYCPITVNYTRYMCSRDPLPVDRALDRRLAFRTIKTVGDVTCGTAGAAGEPEEVWCWGDTTREPSKRAAFPAGWPTT